MSDMPPEIDWIDSYYEALEFFYWEPQHIGRKKHADGRLRTVDQVQRHLRRMETTLNQLLSQFFLLAPTSLRNRLFERLFDEEFRRPFVSLGRDVDELFSLQKATQPDLLFVSDREVVAIEMKIGAKCSVEQVLKYALLALAVEIRTGRTMAHRLALLGHGDFARQWQERFTSPAELVRALRDADIDAFLAKTPQFQEYADRLTDIVTESRFSYFDYADLAGFLRAERPSDHDQTAGAEVYRKLIDGVLAELDRRHLCP